MKYIPVGVDIAKHLIQVHFIDENTGEVVDKQLRGRDFLEYFSNREPCLTGMETCGGSQLWARELSKLTGCCNLYKIWNRLCSGTWFSATCAGKMDPEVEWQGAHSGDPNSIRSNCSGSDKTFHGRKA